MLYVLPESATLNPVTSWENIWRHRLFLEVRCSLKEACSPAFVVLPTSIFDFTEQLKMSGLPRQRFRWLDI
jgi:hypothetical protein